MIIFFFFNDTATTEIYTLSLHDALPISHSMAYLLLIAFPVVMSASSFLLRKQTRLIIVTATATALDRKSTRLNSSHANISYAVFCLKKKNYITSFHPHLTLNT